MNLLYQRRIIPSPLSPRCLDMEEDPSYSIRYRFILQRYGPWQVSLLSTQDSMSGLRKTSMMCFNLGVLSLLPCPRSLFSYGNLSSPVRSWSHRGVWPRTNSSFLITISSFMWMPLSLISTIGWVWAVRLELMQECNILGSKRNVLLITLLQRND